MYKWLIVVTHTQEELGVYTGATWYAAVRKAAKEHNRNPRTLGAVAVD